MAVSLTRAPWSYDYQAITRNKAREAFHLARHAGWMVRDFIRWPLARTARGLGALGLLALVVVVLVAVRLAWPRAFRAFLAD